MMIKKVAGQVHLWLGLASGIIVFVVSITGCIYVFEDELRAPFEKHFQYITETNHKKLLPSQIEKIGRQALADKIPTENTKVGYAYLSIFSDNTRSAFYYVYDEPLKLYHYVYINPYSGKVLKIKNMHHDFFQIVIAIHTSLYLPYKIGHQIVGAAVLIFVVMLVTGMVLWWPKNKAAAKQRFTIKFKARWRRLIYDLHNVNGFYVLPLALIISFTGLVWSYDWFADCYTWVANGGNTNITQAEPVSKTDKQTLLTITLVDSLFEGVTKKLPGMVYYTVDFPASDSACYVVGASPSTLVYYNTTYFYFDQYTGKMLKYESLDIKSTGEKLMSMNYDIHIGKIIGLPGQILAFIGSFIAALLPITGFLIWWGRRKKTRRRKNFEKSIRSY